MADSAGCSFIHLAIALHARPPSRDVVDHRAADDGPARVDDRRRARSFLDDDVLDRIDQIVAPGTNINPTDAGYFPPALSDPSRRRRSSERPDEDPRLNVTEQGGRGARDVAEGVHDAHAWRARPPAALDSQSVGAGADGRRGSGRLDRGDLPDRT